jgi:hypothetical protein
MHWLHRVFAPQNRPFIIYLSLLACLLAGAQYYKGHRLTPASFRQVTASVRRAVTDKNEIARLKMERSTLEFQLPHVRLKYPVLTNTALAAQWPQATLLSQLDPQVCATWRAYLDQVAPILQQRAPALATFLTLQQGYELEVERLAREPFLQDKPARLMLLRTNKFAPLFTQPGYLADAAHFQAAARELDDATTLALHRAYQQALAESATNLNPNLAEYGAAHLACELKTDTLRGQIAELTARLEASQTAALSQASAPAGQAAFSAKDLLSRGLFETYIPERQDFISLELATLILGLVLTSPVELRDRRWLKIGVSLVLVFLCLLALRIHVGLGIAERGTNVFAFCGFLVPAALLAAVWASDFTFFFSKLFVQLIDPAGPEATEEARLRPAYAAIHQGHYRQALKLLKPKLLLDPWHYETLVLKATLHRRLNHHWRASRALKKLLRNPHLDPAQRENVQYLLRNLKHPTDPCWSLVPREAPREELEELSTYG